MDDLLDELNSNQYDEDFEEIEEEEEEEEEEEDEEEEEEEGYPYPIGPMPQEIHNDLRSLDEMVSTDSRDYVIIEYTDISPEIIQYTYRAITKYYNIYRYRIYNIHIYPEII